MLVKILSYAASVVGSARHRAILASCFVLIIAFAGILSIPLMHSAPTVKLAGSAQDETDTDTQSDPVWLSKRQLQPRGPEETSTQPTPKPASSSTKQATNTPVAPDESDQSEAVAELGLSENELLLKPGSTSSDMSARVNKTDSEIAWSIVTEKNLTADDIIIVSGEQLESSISFRIRTGPNVKEGTYQIVVTAKSETFNLTKTLTVTVQ